LHTWLISLLAEQGSCAALLRAYSDFPSDIACPPASLFATVLAVPAHSGDGEDTAAGTSGTAASIKEQDASADSGLVAEQLLFACRHAARLHKASGVHLCQHGLAILKLDYS
jgi:hypothetical protein